MEENKTPKRGLLPTLGLYTTLAIVVGAVIGSGIFKKPAVMAEVTGSPELMLFVWVLAGVLTLFGALSNAEVASMIPETGGQYVYFDKMYGKFIAFMYGWALLAVIQTGSIASIAYVFAEYSQEFSALILPRFSTEIEQSITFTIPFIGKFFPLENIGVKAITIGVILFLSFVNYLGVRFGGQISFIFTVAKVLAILVLVGFGFAYSDGSVVNLTTDAASFSSDTKIMFAGIVGALSAAFWSYDGWNNITYIAGEVKKPMINIPKALIIGTLIIIAVYLLINVAFLYVIPIEQMAGSTRIAADVANIAMGPIGAMFVAAAVMASTFGTTNGTIMVSSRVYYAMSQKGLFFKKIGKSHDKYFTPGNALILQAVWSSVLVMSGTFDQLTDMLIFVSWIFYAGGAYGVFVLRKKMPDTPRPYKVWGYPFVPAIFVFVATIYVIATLYTDIESYINGDSEIIRSVFGLFLLSLGIPFYLYFNKKNYSNN
jgi:basic amino acid/polyamine antiporter, APA family